MKKRIFYATLQKELVVNNNLPFTGINTFFGSCQEKDNFFYSKEESIRNSILEILVDKNILLSQNTSEFIDFFRDIFSKASKEYVNASIFLVQKNEYIEITSNGFDKHDFRNFFSGRIVLTNDPGMKIYKDIDCGLNSDSFEISTLISSFEDAFLELMLRIKNSSKDNKEPLNTVKKVIFSPGTAGFLAHEIFGHLLETDMMSNKFAIYGNQIKLGDKIGPEMLNIIDDVCGYEDYIGLNKIDDEGEDLRPVSLVKDGILSGFISDLKSGNKLGYANAGGCARRESYKRRSMPRMRATFIKKNKKGRDLNQCINTTEDGFVVNNISAGNVNPTNGFFHIYCSSGSFVKNGEIKENVQDVFISGTIQKSLLDIIEIGKDFNFFPSFCVKGGQQLPVCVGSPTVIIDSLNIGGLNYGF